MTHVYTKLGLTSRVQLARKRLATADVAVRKLTRLLREFAAIEAVVGHPPRRESVRCNVQRDVWIAVAFLDVMWPQILYRDDVDFTRPNPAGPPAIARTITADLGAVDGIDDHADTN
jgi:hypothetical protein